MANQYRTLNRTVLCKVESTSGTDAAPVVGTDAMACVSPTWQGGPETLDTDQEVTGALDVGAPIVGGGGASFSTSVYLKGSGTGGTAPEFSAALKAAGLALTTLAAAVTGTAQAGAASTITLAAGASATNDFYKGEVIYTTGGTGSGQTRVITGYVGSTKVATVTPAWTTTPDATTTYSVYACNVYIPASSSLVTATIYDYMHRADAGASRLRALLGGAATLQMQFANKQLPTAAFNFSGKFVTPTDPTAPSSPTLQSTRATAIIGVDCTLGGVSTKFSTMTIDTGNQVAVDDDPTDTYGMDIGGITRRKITGRINPPLDLLSVRNVWTSFLAGTETSLWLRWGSASGNRVSLLLPRIVYTGQENEDVNGFGHEGIPFAAVGSNTGMYLSFY